MQENKSQKGSDLFIVDNSDSDWKVRNYLHEWTDLCEHEFINEDEAEDFAESLKKKIEKHK